MTGTEMIEAAVEEGTTETPEMVNKKGQEDVLTVEMKDIKSSTVQSHKVAEGIAVMMTEMAAAVEEGIISDLVKEGQ